MLFITHLIVNERNAISSSSPLYMGPRKTAESKADSTDGAQDIPALPQGTGKEKAANVTDQCHGHKSTAAPGWSLAAKAWALNSCKCHIV